MALLTARPSLSKIDLDDPFFIDVEECPNWPTLFDNDQPIKLEIGFGSGDFLIEMALNEPESNFIGIDFSPNGINKLISRIHYLQIKNIRIVYGDANIQIPLLFKNEVLSTIYINFPDPWPKIRHFYRRLIKPELVKLIADKVVPKGKVHLSTDSQEYALEILDYFNSEPLFQNSNRQAGFFLSRNQLPKTRYERSFLYSGDNVYYLEYIRISEDEKNNIRISDALKNVVEESKISAVAGNPDNPDEYLIKKFNVAEAKARDCCDFKMIADDLVAAGDNQSAERLYIKAAEIAQDSLDFNWLAYSVYNAFGGVQWVKDLYLKSENLAKGSVDNNWLAYSIWETIGDVEWSKKLFEKAAANPENVRELCDLADSISITIQDKSWENKIFQAAEDIAEEYSGLLELADCVYSKAGDIEWARRIYLRAENKAEDCSDLNTLLDRLCTNLGDKEWARKVCAAAERKAESCCEFLELAHSVFQNLGDDELAKRLYEYSEDKAELSFEYRWLADSLFVSLKDRKWAEKLYKLSETKAETFYDFSRLAESVKEKLGDQEWVESLCEQAKRMANEPSDLNRLNHLLR